MPGGSTTNWEALINGQRLFLTQVVFLHIKVAAFMEVSLIELSGMCLIPPQPRDIRPKGSRRASVPSSPSSLLPRFGCSPSGRVNSEAPFFSFELFLSVFRYLFYSRLVSLPLCRPHVPPVLHPPMQFAGWGTRRTPRLQIYRARPICLIYNPCLN